MHAYVTLRGSRSARHVTRDASPRKIHPYAALVIAHPDGSSTRFELSYGSLDAGKTVTVYLRQTRPGESGEDVYSAPVNVL
jgi:hypothetical protein